MKVLLVKDGKVKVFAGMAASSLEITRKLQEEMRLYRTPFDKAMEELLPKKVVICTIERQ